ncbi:unnamed protein product [Acanthoscelides obtectus]|uniref:Uncharacterized protein n=1 Tax=Acanthoscelides obtectus TaxID=200917 RepID=A0A9P0PLI6_ACAOB|nr:unnamed protein product [Acanthoscelides obtectus]CAK1674049.1 hypothetical protein AOBTE_LOCUS29515 [Acanthoscelides obtectus]
MMEGSHQLAPQIWPTSGNIRLHSSNFSRLGN